MADSVLAILSDDSRSDEEVLRQLEGLRDRDPDRFRHVAHFIRSQYDPKEVLEDNLAIGLVEQVAFGLPYTPPSGQRADRMDGVSEFLDLPLDEQWQSLANRVAGLESVKQDALRVWDSRGKPVTLTGGLGELNEVRSATRPLIRRAKKLLREAVPNRRDAFRSRSVEDALEAWIFGSALIGGPIDPDTFDPTQGLGELPRWVSREEGKWILLGADGAPVAFIVLMNPDSMRPLPPGLSAKFHLIDRRATGGMAEIFDNLDEAKAAATKWLPVGSQPPCDPTGES